MLLDPGMVGGALQREVEGNLEPALLRVRDERVEVLDCAEIRVHRVVAAVRRTDRPRAARIIDLCDECVVAALAIGRPDRMDRR
jgi:hypothetical protein